MVFGRVDFVGALTFTYFPSPSHFITYELHTNALTHHQLKCFRCEFIDSIENEWHGNPNKRISIIIIPVVCCHLLNCGRDRHVNAKTYRFTFRKKKITNLRHLCYTFSHRLCRDFFVARCGRNKNHFTLKCGTRRAHMNHMLFFFFG